MKYCFFDLETDGLLDKVTTTHCAVAYMEDVQKYHVYFKDKDAAVIKENYVYFNDMQDWLRSLDGYTLVGHNIIQYDLQVLKKLYNFASDIDNVLDTLVLSRLYYPDREGHSLKWWGNEFRFPKGDFDDWSAFSQEMLTYCVRDVDLCRRIFMHLQEEEGTWDWSESIKLTNRFYDIMGRQSQHGVLFSVSKAEVLLAKVEQEIQEIEEKVLQTVPRKAVQVGAVVNKPFLKNGSYSKAVQEWIQTL